MHLCATPERRQDLVHEPCSGHPARRKPHHRHSDRLLADSADLKTNSALAPVQGIANPICEGSLIASTSTGRVYFSNPSSRHWRGNSQSIRPPTGYTGIELEKYGALLMATAPTVATPHSLIGGTNSRCCSKVAFKKAHSTGPIPSFVLLECPTTS